MMRSRAGAICGLSTLLIASHLPAQGLTAKQADSVARTAVTAWVRQHAESIARTDRRRADSSYIRVLESTNQQLSNKWSAVSVIIALLTALLTVGGIVAAVMIWLQGSEFRERLKAATDTLEATRKALETSQTRVGELTQELSAKVDESKRVVADTEREKNEMLERLRKTVEEKASSAPVVGEELTNLLELQQRLRTPRPSKLTTPRVSRFVHFTSGSWQLTGTQSAKFELEGPGVKLKGDIGDFNQQLVGPRRPAVGVSFDFNSYGFSLSSAEAVIDDEVFSNVTIRGNVMTKGKSQMWEPGTQVMRSDFAMAGIIDGYQRGLGGAYPDEHPPVYRIRFSAAGLAVAEIAPSSDEHVVWVTKVTFALVGQGPRLQSA